MSKTTKKKTTQKKTTQKKAPEEKAPKDLFHNGAPTKTPQKIQAVQSSRCPSCDSTERSPYKLSRPPLILSGITPDGKRFSHVVWRSTKCRSCGQLRIDKEFLYNPNQDELEEL